MGQESSWVAQMLDCQTSCKPTFQRTSHPWLLKFHWGNKTVLEIKESCRDLVTPGQIYIKVSLSNFVTAGGVDKKLQYRPKGVLLSNLILHCFIKFNKVGKVWATIEFRHVCNNFCPLASMGKVWQRGKSWRSFSQSGFSLSLPQRTAQYNGSGKRNSYPSLAKIQNGWKI